MVGKDEELERGVFKRTLLDGVVGRKVLVILFLISSNSTLIVGSFCDSRLGSREASFFSLDRVKNPACSLPRTRVLQQLLLPRTPDRVPGLHCFLLG